MIVLTYDYVDSIIKFVTLVQHQFAFLLSLVCLSYSAVYIIFSQDFLLVPTNSDKGFCPIVLKWTTLLKTCTGSNTHKESEEHLELQLRKLDVAYDFVKQ